MKSSEEKTMTVGEASLKAQANKENFVPSEIQQEVHKGSNSKKSYEEEVNEAIQRGLNDEAIHGDFYVVVLYKRERLLKNVVRQMFFYRQSCPTPEFDQTVYKYFRKDHKIEYLWTVPNVMTCQWLPMMREYLPHDQMDLLKFVDEYMSGELDKKCSRLNKELVK